MALPFFYAAEINKFTTRYTLDEETSKHVVQVLRMKEGEALQLTNGAGDLFTAEIVTDHKKHCEVIIKGSSFTPAPVRKITIAISLLKNASRFEWFLEKATEIGVTEIMPLLCQRTEKERFRQDRMQQILVSAMLQSQQSWLPKLHEPVQLEKAIKESGAAIKLIAHCIDGEKQSLHNYKTNSLLDSIILIGPEGDFTPTEINLALQHQFKPVTLGETRLRTETAGMVAAAILKMETMDNRQ
jgi:16S rRNA (uracil1498-N3)-methyltransferase